MKSKTWNKQTIKNYSRKIQQKQWQITGSQNNELNIIMAKSQCRQQRAEEMPTGSTKSWLDEMPKDVSKACKMN